MWNKTLISILSIVLYSTAANAAKLPMVGAAIDNDTPPRPTGVCSGGRTFNLTAGGALTTTQTGSSIAVFKAASYENSNGGVGYGYADGATNSQQLLTFDLDQTTLIETSSTQKSLSNNPDSSNAIRGNVINNTRGDGAFIVFGRKVVAPCNINPCLHVRTYKNSTTFEDVTNTGIVIASGVTSAHVTSDATPNYWITYNDASLGGNSIARLSGSFNVLSSGVANTTNVYGEITSDTDYIYVIANLGGNYNVRRIKKTTLAITDYNLFSTNVATALFHYDGYLYAGVPSGGFGTIKKIRTSDMTVVGTITMGANDAVIAGGLSVDSANAKLYAVIGVSGTSANYRRININTFANEQTLSVVRMPQSFGVGFDFPHQRIYVAHIESTNFIVQQINLCS